MKNMIKKNQVMITALAIMIAVAGYLNFAGTKVTEEDIMTVNGEIETDDMGNLALVEEETDYSVLLDLSEEDMETIRKMDTGKLKVDFNDPAMAKYLINYDKNFNPNK